MVELTAIVQTGLGAVAGVGLSLTDTWQALIGDRIAAFRLMNALKYQPKIEAELKKADVKLNAAKVPDRYAFAWFEEATKQDEDEIQDLFAKLLAQAAAGNEDALDRRLLDIVSALTPSDAITFKTVYDDFDWRNYKMAKRRYTASWSFGRIYSVIKKANVINEEKSIEHLFNVGLLSQTFDLDGGSISGAVSYAFRENRVPDLSKLQLKDSATSTAMGISLYLALYPMDLTWPAPEASD